VGSTYYEQFGYLATYSWLKMFWEKASMFDIKVVVADFTTKFPRKGDQLIMQVLIASGYMKEMLIKLN
jgi:hypothetical protein